MDGSATRYAKRRVSTFLYFCLFPGAVCRIQRAAMGSGLSIFRQNERCPEMPLPSIFSPAMLSRPVPGENFLPSPGVLGTGA